MLRFFLISSFFSFALFSHNPWDLKITERIVNRKHISHIILETRPDHYRITLLVSDRFPYNYKSKSYPLYLKIENEKIAITTAKELDQYLDRGFELSLHLKGSEIISFTYHDPN
ncbi:MAG: hypothetical protein L6Q54_08490 [Leptospiraceae bacterium]|nr:hypothetical protein [Leptospiraceae bacterium]MCK6381272.1 hypothetical protein [Leptospiraceae bacterium]NUM41814.1 hypothetical protein [Leptospiraceae bacterium]